MGGALEVAASDRVYLAIPRLEEARVAVDESVSARDAMICSWGRKM